MSSLMCNFLQELGNETEIRIFFKQIILDCLTGKYFIFNFDWRVKVFTWDDKKI